MELIITVWGRMDFGRSASLALVSLVAPGTAARLLPGYEQKALPTWLVLLAILMNALQGGTAKGDSVATNADTPTSRTRLHDRCSPADITIIIKGSLIRTIPCMLNELTLEQTGASGMTAMGTQSNLAQLAPKIQAACRVGATSSLNTPRSGKALFMIARRLGSQSSHQDRTSCRRKLLRYAPLAILDHVVGWMQSSKAKLIVLFRTDLRWDSHQQLGR